MERLVDQVESHSAQGRVEPKARGVDAAITVVDVSRSKRRVDVLESGRRLADRREERRVRQCGLRFRGRYTAICRASVVLVGRTGDAFATRHDEGGTGAERQSWNSDVSVKHDTLLEMRP